MHRLADERNGSHDNQKRPKMKHALPPPAVVLFMLTASFLRADAITAAQAAQHVGEVQTVRVTGMITVYWGTPEIVVHGPVDIIVDQGS
jgi:hypothetical protein